MKDAQIATLHTIYAQHDERTVRVYQAYCDQIADEAVALGAFGPSFGLEGIFKAPNAQDWASSSGALSGQSPPSAWFRHFCVALRLRGASLKSLI